MTRFFVRLAGRGLAIALAALPLLAAAAPVTLFNTGVSAAGTPLPNNAAELHYTLINAPAGATTALRTATAANGYPIPPWIGDDPLSDWIGPASGSQLSGPVGNYTYRTTFSLAGLDPLSAMISGRWATDDMGLNILLNGVSTGQTTTGGYTSFTSFLLNSNFVAGLNTLDFVLANSGGGPTGLRVEMTGTANPAAAVPEPSSIAIAALGLVGLALARRRRVRTP